MKRRMQLAAVNIVTTLCNESPSESTKRCEDINSGGYCTLLRYSVGNYRKWMKTF